MLSENKMLLAKIETTYGTDSTPDATNNFIAACNISVTPNLTYNDTCATDGSLSPRAGTLGQKYMQVTFDHQLQMESSSDYKTPPIDPLLLACGYVDATDGIYKPRTTGFQSVTLYVYEEDLLWKITGCRGDVEFDLSAGNDVTLKFTFQGAYTTPTITSGTFPSSWTDKGGSPVVAMGGTFAWGSENPTIESLAFGLHNDVSIVPSIAATNGITGAHIVNRKPEGSFDPEVVFSNDIDFWTPYEALTQTAITYSVNDGTAKMDISIPKTEITQIATGDRSGVLKYDITFRPIRDSGDDEISLTFAAV